MGPEPSGPEHSGPEPSGPQHMDLAKSFAYASKDSWMLRFGHYRGIRVIYASLLLWETDDSWMLTATVA